MYPRGCDLESMEKTEIDKNIDKTQITYNQLCEATTNAMVILKVKKCHMKMAGCGVIGTCDLFLSDTYQELMDTDSDFTMTGTIINICRKHVSWWTLVWKNNFITTKIHNKSFCTNEV